MTPRPIGPVLLHLSADISPEVRADFDRFCEAHVRGNLGLPGFLSARRLERSASWPGAGAALEFLTVYQLEDTGALVSEACAAHDASVPEAFLPHLRFERSVFRELDPVASPLDFVPGAAIFHVVTQVEPGFEADFQRWYAGEHVPAVLTTPGMLGARQFVRVEDPAGLGAAALPYTRLAIYEMEDRAVISRPESLRAAQATPCPPELDRHRQVSHHVFEAFFSAP